MKLNSYLAVGISCLALALSACGDKNNNAPANNAPSGGTNTPQASCDNLAGAKFAGVAGQGGGRAEGCEGCGNPGSIEFSSGGNAELSWPGDDVLQRCTYSVNGAQLALSCDGSNKALQFSQNCSRLTSGELVFVRQ